MGNLAKVMDKVTPVVIKFTNMKGVIALKEGIMFTLPLSLIGSIFLLLAQMPYKPFNDLMTSVFGSNWTDPLWQVYGGTFALMGIVSCIAIAYNYAKAEGHEPLTAGILAFVTFFIVNKSSITTANGETISSIIDKNWTGGQGMVTGIIIGLCVGAAYSWFLTKKITIKMPDGVPAGVVNQFSALIPGFIIVLVAMILYILFKFGINTTFPEWIYEVLQVPLQGVSDSVVGALVLGTLVPFLWWFGVHGVNVIAGVMNPLMTANYLENQAMIDQGHALTISNGAHIVTQQFQDNFVILTGSGITMGLVLAMVLAGKSAQSKALGKLSLIPGIFNINEPVLFGFPIVLNPFMFVPFLATPTIIAVSTYFALKIGFLQPFSGIVLPWSTPPIISGFILQGWKGIIWQVLIIVLSTVIYLPFFKKQDAINLKNEQESELSV